MSSLPQYYSTHSPDVININGVVLRRQAELPISVLALMVVLGTAVTLWNIHNCAFHSRDVRYFDTYEGAPALYALRRYASSVKKMVKGIASPNHGHRVLVSSLEDSEEPTKAESGPGGRAHLGHQYFALSSPGTKNLTRWNLDRRVQSYVDGNVAYNEGSLVVEESGYYYVYSQVSFVKALRDWAVNQSVVSHELIRFSNATNEAESLLRTQKNHRWDKQLRCSLDASYLGATFFLQKGDRIFVAVSDTNFMWQSPRRTYLGIRSL